MNKLLRSNMSMSQGHVSSAARNSLERRCCFPALFSAAHPCDVIARRPFSSSLCFVSRRSNFFICKARSSFAGKQRSRSLERVFRGSGGYCTGRRLRRGGIDKDATKRRSRVGRLTQRKVCSGFALVALRGSFLHRGAAWNI